MKNIQSLIRPNIQILKPYVSARVLCQGKDLILMDANENPYGDGIRNRYPDPFQNDLRKKLADMYSLNFEQILLGNGSDELIDMLIRVFCEPGLETITICPPTFGLYQVSAQINNVGVEEVSLNEEFELDVKNILKTNSKILFLPNPNAPTGNLFKKECLENILESFPGVVMLDETYMDFSDQPSWVSRLSEFPNLVVLQTFSKYWGLAGYRIGMLFASEEIVKALSKIKAPYNLNNLSAQEALLALGNTEEIERNAQIICQERELLREEIQPLSFIQKVYPSETNFLWIQSEEAWNICEFLKQEGLLVRKYLNEPNFFRVSVGLPEENLKFITILKNFQK